MQLKDFKEEITTVWSFPERGKWATHNSRYRGNYAPQVARNLIQRYTGQYDWILDPMVGSGTSLIESKLLCRNAIGIDINPYAIELSKKALNFEVENDNCKQDAYVGDARELSNISDESIDFIIFHPPYLNIIKYSQGVIKEDLSNISNVGKFFDEIEIIAKELLRVLKHGKYCSVLIGDTRKAQHYIPLSYFLLQRFLKSGFILKEEIIKTQHNCVNSKKWEENAIRFGFYLIMHEHLFVFRKPKIEENLSKIRWSCYI